MFADRADAGRQLEGWLVHLQNDDVVVVGLPRGGVPVAHEVAFTLDAPLDVILVRKLGVPSRPEVAMGAIGEGGIRVVNDDVLGTQHASLADFEEVEDFETEELRKRIAFYRANRDRIDLEGRVVVVIDDGLATGSTAKAACLVARASGAAKVVLAVPVAPRGWEDRLAGCADELISVITPENFRAVGQFYEDFSEISDTEVIEHLRQADHRLSSS